MGKKLTLLAIRLLVSANLLYAGMMETTLVILFLIPKTARLGAKLILVWISCALPSHIFVLGYDSVFVDALIVFVLTLTYLLSRRQSHLSETEAAGTAGGVLRV